jgi:hypothetical protein
VWFDLIHQSIFQPRLTNAHFFGRKAGALPLRNQLTLVLVVKALIISYS